MELPDIPMDVEQTCSITLDDRVLGRYRGLRRERLKEKLGYLPHATEVVDYDTITVKFDCSAELAKAHVTGCLRGFR